MADDRTHPPTPKKIRSLRERGDVWQSRDLTSAASLLAAVAAVSYNLSPAAHTFAWIVKRSIEVGTSRGAESSGHAIAFAGGVLAHASILVAPVIIAPVAVGILVSLIQVRPLFTLEPLALNLSKLNPFTGIRQRVFSRDAFIELLKALLKGIIVASLVWSTVRSQWGSLIECAGAPPAATAMFIRDTATSLGFQVCAALLALALADTIYQRWSWRSRNSMTDEEFRREIKEDQTSPEVLRRRAQRRDELRTAHMIERLADADFGTLNPTHIACFLRYDSSKEGAPRVIAKGRGWAAKLLIEAARRKGVPMVRRPSLARALFKLRVDSQIPRELHVAVATVMNWLDRQASDRGRSTKWSARRSQDDL